MEGTKQAENTAKSWAETQLKIYDKWFETFQAASAPKAFQGLEQIRKTTIDSWEESVKSSLHAQAELGRIVVDTLGSWGPAPAQNGDGAFLRQLREVVKSSTDAQTQIWSSWFDAARKLDVSLVTGSWDKLVEATQQAVRKAWEAQAEWVRPENYAAAASGTKTTK
jgi:hypothetical protein